MNIVCDFCEKGYDSSISNFERYNHHYCCATCKYKGELRFSPDIETFQLELWEKPITELASEYNVSAKTVHKFCEKHKLIKPGKGYWQKKRYPFKPKTY